MERLHTNDSMLFFCVGYAAVLHRLNTFEVCMCFFFCTFQRKTRGKIITSQKTAVKNMGERLCERQNLHFLPYEYIRVSVELTKYL